MKRTSGRGLQLGLCAALFAFAACGDDDKPKNMDPPPVVGGDVQILTFVANPIAGTQNGKSTLSWETRDAGQVRILQGTVQLFSTTEMVATGSFEVNLPSATNMFTLEASKGSDLKTQTITVTALPPVEQQARIVAFTITPTSWMTSPQVVTLEWSTENATDVTLTANGTAVSTFPGGATGTSEITITDTTVFVLTAARGNQQVTQSRTSTRQPPMGTGDIEPNDTTTTAQTLMLMAGMGEVTAAIDPAGDLDIFAIDIPADGSIIAATGDPGGTCGAFDSILTLIAPDRATVIAENDDVNGAASQFCSALDARSDSRVRNLPAGRYYLAVRGFTDAQGSATGPYVLQVEVRTPACGNQILNPSLSEQCDDGNTVAADGCDAICALEVGGMFTGPSTVARSLTGALAAGASQYVQLTLTATAWIQAQTFAPTAPTCTSADTILILLNSQFDAITGNDDIAQDNTCSLIEPGFTQGARILPPDTYYLRVVAPADPVAAFELVVDVFEAGCGNGVIDISETCDDGNASAGDGCDATCRPEPVAAVVEPGQDVTIDFRSPTEVVAFSVTTSEPGQTITATLATTPQQPCPLPAPTLALYDANWAELGRVGPRVVQGVPVCASLTPATAPFVRNLPAGTFYVVAINDQRAIGDIGLSIRIVQATCGNGILETAGGERCDDQNTVSGDGCDDACQFETSGAFTVETEPNGALAESNPALDVVGQTVTYAGTIEPEDADHFTVVVPQGATASLAAQTYGLLGDLASCNGDTRLAVLDSAGVLIAENDDSGTLCSNVTGAPELMALAEGTYYVRVTGYDALTAVSTYYVDITLTP